MMPISAHSFDIFDTCLTRVHIRPIDLFYDVAHRAMPVLCPYGHSASSVHGFVRLRRLAERLARQEQQSLRDDISLFDIYSKFSDISPWYINIEDMMLVELAVERDFLKPIPAMLSQVRAVRAAGYKILFISDMYLPAWFLKECLQTYGFAEDQDEVYVSGEIGLSKHTGRLYTHVLNQHNIQPAQLIHLGDTYHSDVVVPSKLGIQSKLFEDAHLTRHQQLKYAFIDDGFSSRLVGLGRLLRLKLPEIMNREFMVLACDVIAPLLTAYVAWVLIDAKKKGISRLYFVSRDGQILHKIAQRLTVAWSGPECHYLYGSRQAWFLASVTEVTRPQLAWLLAEIEYKTPRYVFQRLHISTEEILDTLSQYGFFHRLDEPLVSSDAANLWECLQHPKISCQILHNAKECRNLAVKYFTQEDLFLSNKRWAIVDIGWTLKCQMALQSILTSGGFYSNIYGYYFGVRTSLVDSSLHGYYSALTEDGIQHCPASIRCDGLYYAGNMALLEHVFTMADHPTVIGYKQYEDNFIPVFASNNNADLFEGPTRSLQELIIKYVDESLSIGLEPSHVNRLIQSSFSSFKLLITRPTFKEAKSLSDIMVHIDQAHAIKRPIAAPLKWSDVARIFFNRFGWLPAYELSGPVWLEGSAALSSPPVRFLVANLLRINGMIKRLLT